ncbi:MAG: lysylphosphatidylglycerol synthase transmembrane domain-containing protein [Chloroflexota bacterium]
MLRTLWKHFGSWLPWLAVAGLLGLLVQAVNPTSLALALRHADLWLILPILGCGLIGLLMRAIRWHLLLSAIDAPNSLLDSILLFTASQSVMLVPGGQFLLPVLQRSQHGTLIRRSAATILVQELVFGVLVLPAALPGLPFYHYGGLLLFLALVFSGGTAAAFLHGDLSRFGLGLAARIPFLRGHVPTFCEVQRHFVLIANSKAALWGSIFDMLAIGAAGTGFYIALFAVGVTQLTWPDALAIYALGSAVGTISALPGGVGANEDISTLVLTKMGLAAGPAAAATLLFRVVNLLMGVILGWAVLFFASRRFQVQPSFAGLVRACRRVECSTLAVREDLSS